MKTMTGLANLGIDGIYGQISDDKDQVAKAINAVVRVQILKSLKVEDSSPAKEPKKKEIAVVKEEPKPEPKSEEPKIEETKSEPKPKEPEPKQKVEPKPEKK